MSKQSLSEFVNSCWTDPVLCEKNGVMTEPSAIALIHVKNGFRNEEIDSVRFTGTKKWDLEILAERFEKKAAHYSQDLTGVQTFILKAFWDGKREPKAQQPFTVTGQLSSEADGMVTEAPTNTGVVQQTMRHLEAMVQTFHKQTALILEASQSMMTIQSLRENKLRTENQDMFTLVRDLLMQQTEAEMQRRSEELTRNSRSAQLTALLNLAPPLINSITGKDVFPQASADTALLDNLAKKLTPEMVQKLAEILPSDMLAPMASRFKRALDDKREASADGERRLSNGVDTDKELS